MFFGSNTKKISMRFITLCVRVSTRRRRGRRMKRRRGK